MTDREIMQQALDWAYSNGETVFAGGGMKAVDGMNAWTKAIREALAQPEQEPVAWMRQDGKRVTTASDLHNYPDYETRYSIPLYTTPPQRTWVGLDNDDLIWIYSNSDKIGQAISNTEAKLKEKNL